MSAANFSDLKSLEGIRTRDPGAWEAMVDAYLPQLLRAGRGMGFSPDEAQDLAQSVFLALMESIQKFEGRSHIRTYLFGIFYNKVSEHLRGKQRERENDPIDEVVESRFDSKGRWRQPPTDIERDVFGQEVGGMIEECLEDVPRAQRVAFYLREVEEMETKEICKKLSVSGTNFGCNALPGPQPASGVSGEEGAEKGVVMYRCAEVVRLISSDEYLAAGFWRRIPIRFHLAMCDNCSRYARQLRAIARLFRKIVEDVPDADIKSAKLQILQRLKEQ